MQKQLVIGALIGMIATGQALATITVQHLWKLGEADPGATAGGVANATTIDSVGSLNLAKSGATTVGGTLTYSSNVPGNPNPGPVPKTGSSLSGNFGNAPAGGPDANAYFYTAGGAIGVTDNFGIDVWVNSATADNSGTGQRGYIMKDGNTLNGFGLLQLGNQYGALVDQYMFYGGPVVTVGEWTHLALVRDGGTNSFYVNGSLVASSATPIIAGLTDFSLGAVYDGSYRFNGKIDEARYFTFSPGAFNVQDLNIIPEPSTIFLFGAGAGLLGWRRRK